MSVSKEEFADWQQHPVTEFVLKQMKAWAEVQQSEWAAIAWQKGEIDPLLLCEARTRADCYNEIPDSSLADWLAIEEKLSDS